MEAKWPAHIGPCSAHTRLKEMVGVCDPLIQEAAAHARHMLKKQLFRPCA